jgi:hypothetical protein
LERKKRKGRKMGDLRGIGEKEEIEEVGMGEAGSIERGGRREEERGGRDFASNNPSF